MLVGGAIERERVSGKHTWETEERIRFCGDADADEGGVGLVVDFSFPVVDFVLFGYGEVALDAAFGVEKLDLSAAFDETIGDFKLGLEFPG